MSNYPYVFYQDYKPRFKGFGRSTIVKVQRGSVMRFGTIYEYGDVSPRYPVPALRCMVRIHTATVDLSHIHEYGHWIIKELWVKEG